MNQTVRTDWTMDEIKVIYDQPLLDLVYQSATVHRQWHERSRG